MGRAHGGSKPTPGGARSAKVRTQIALPLGSRDLIDGRLEDMPLDRDALKLAMSQFGATFDLEQFRSAFDARDARERNRARLVTSNFQAVADGIVELVREAVTVMGLRPMPRSLNVNPDIDAVRQDGGLNGRQASELVQLKKLANDLRHAYISVTADDVHAGVHLLLKQLPQFTAAYVTWLAEYGITL